MHDTCQTGLCLLSLNGCLIQMIMDQIEHDACRDKLQALEAKHRTLVQDKNALQGEKAAMERELKGLRGQAGKLTKVNFTSSHSKVGVVSMCLSQAGKCSRA